MREALGFLTVLGGPSTPTPRAVRWFPVVGAAIGAAVGATWWLADQAFSVLVAAAIVVLVDAAITGMLHLDGLADAADGLLPHASRARRLEIMRTPGLGAFGAVTVAAVVVLRVAALAARPADVGLLVALWCVSRTAVAIAPAWLDYVRDDGLASPLLTTPAARWPIAAVAPAFALAVVTAGAAGAAAVVVALAGAACVLALGRSRLGGFTGDVLGAAIVVAETVGLVAAGVRW